MTLIKHLDAAGLFTDHIASGAYEAGKLTVVSPDPGGIKRAERLRKRLVARLGRPIGMAFVEKYRALGVVTGEAIRRIHIGGSIVELLEQ